MSDYTLLWNGSRAHLFAEGCRSLCSHMQRFAAVDSEMPEGYPRCRLCAKRAQMIAAQREATAFYLAVKDGAVLQGDVAHLVTWWRTAEEARANGWSLEEERFPALALKCCGLPIYSPDPWWITGNPKMIRHRVVDGPPTCRNCLRLRILREPPPLIVGSRVVVGNLNAEVVGLPGEKVRVLINGFEFNVKRNQVVPLANNPAA